MPSMMKPPCREFFVIVRSDESKDPNHWTSHPDFVGAFHATLAAANAALANLTASSSHNSPEHSDGTLDSSRPMPGSRTSSASSASTIESASNSNDADAPTPSHGHVLTRSKSQDGRCRYECEGGIKYEVRKIAARSLCGSMTWWFADEAGGEDAGSS